MIKQLCVQTSRLYQRKKGIKCCINNNSYIPLKRTDREKIYAMIKAVEVDLQNECTIHHPQSIMCLDVVMKLEREVIVILIVIDRDVQAT